MFVNHRCPHELQRFHTPRSGFGCDGNCGRFNLPRDCVLYGCRGCNYDLCSECYMKKMNAVPAFSSTDATRVLNGTGWSCKQVSWEDSKRYFGSSVGPNITDVRLWARTGPQLWTIRWDNFTDRLGKVRASDVAVVAAIAGESKPVTLANWLRHAGAYVPEVPVDMDLAHDELDMQCSIRFQTSFVPAGTEFVPEHYNYQTTDNTNPKNLILLCTSQGATLAQDKRGATRIYPVQDGKKCWLKAEETRFGVGGGQEETDEEREEALAKGKAIASVIGIKSMEARMNVLMTVQIPLRQQEVLRRPSPLFQQMKSKGHAALGYSSKANSGGSNLFGLFEPQSTRGGSGGFSAASTGHTFLCSSSFGSTSPSYAPSSPAYASCSYEPDEPKYERTFFSEPTATAARVSYEKTSEDADRLLVKNPIRSDSEHITITVCTYYTIVGAKPTEDDIRNAVADLCYLYNTVGAGNLSEIPFMTMRKQTNHNVFPS